MSDEPRPASVLPFERGTQRGRGRGQAPPEERTSAAGPPAPVPPARVRVRWHGAIAVVLALTLLVRLPYLPRLGNGYDLEAYRQWTAAIQDYGLGNVFARTDTDYVGYHYLLWAVGKGVGRSVRELTVRDKALRLWLKSPGLAGDLISTVLVIGLAHRLAAADLAPLGARHLSQGPHRRARLRAADGLAPQRGRAPWRWIATLGLSEAELSALGAGLLWGLHPALIYTGAYWGQNDSLVTAFALAAVWAALVRRPARAAALLGIGAVLKPQPLIIAPVLAWVIVRRSGWGGFARATAAGAAAILAGHLYFIATGHLDEVLTIYRNAVVTTQRLSYSAYNLWWPVAWARDPGSSDTAFALGRVAVTWGMLASVLVLVVLGLTAAGLVRRDDDVGVMAACGFLIFGFFMVGTGVHERYDLPALAFLLPVVRHVRSWSLPVLAISATTTINAVMGIPLDRLYPQGQPVWLSMAVAGVNLLTLGWAAWLLIRGTAPQLAAAERTRPPSAH